ncbi:hypothetical protein XI07_13880 [Bradyrhizobium sp. CCBAU 11445]|uniref:hypothetical protein n=1 Tax=Bradyrhizobium sp. CCBAU 11445 TaxID=1630896 RepID=UPI002306636D|nr:hypothetical protein [Bradyrhizobium sp. CCBAU 11445]MDA9483095.1 hypothetical protein [Bradyrhizobium sp. CCBAU 11445]
MILSVEVRLGEGPERGPVVAFVRIFGPDQPGQRSYYGVGAVERNDACGGGGDRSAGCVFGHDHRDGLWALLERACAKLKKADFVRYRCCPDRI